MELVRNNYREDPTVLLYEAAISGCVTTLNTLIQKDRLILNKVSLTSLTETPLQTTMSDSLKRFPLHLASAEGHSQIIKALLLQDKTACLARDEDGRIPLHLAAMRGRVEVIQELVRASSESTFEALDGDTVFHLCIKYNHLEAFKLLVTFINGDEILNIGNQDGNSILHLAAMLKQLETLRYLLSLPTVKVKANALNGMGLTALDLLDQCPRDFKSLQIQDILIKAGIRIAAELISSNNTLPPEPQQPRAIALASTAEMKRSRFEKCMKHLQYNLEETRGALMIVATVIATMTFQAAMNPPGGVWQQDFVDVSGGSACNKSNICEAGTSVLAYAYPDRYIYYITSNSIAFAASFTVIALIVGGFPLKNKFCVWLLAQAIKITLLFLLVSYVTGMLIVTPSRYREKMANMDSKVIGVSALVISFSDIIELIRFAVWTVKKLRKFWHKMKNENRAEERHAV
ncbi:ankyrin repeat-containing protein BDA1 [Jatropha curcas]|uniref:ankyrin repeat-containing protein BDA1 n=1 Tax=Jatropha curcas TaxID=180498 RepID=UPI0018945301|nr:ankyrin repeat-containing protein BDA1 [Jatropha curcas]